MAIPARHGKSTLESTPRMAPQLKVINAGRADSGCGDCGERGSESAEAGISADQLAELAAISQQLETASPQEILEWATAKYADKFTMATAFGPEGMCLIHMLAEVAPQTPIFNLETGYQFRETLELREKVKLRYGITVEFK